VANILQDASKQDLKRLLGSFPVTSLKAGWPSIKGTKEEICFAAAEERDLPRIVAFMKTNFARCRQHVFVLTPPPDLSVNPESAVPDAELVDVDGAGGKILVTRAVFSIFLKDPSEEAVVEFLWPMRVTELYGYLVFSLMVLERNPCIYFDRDCFKLSRSIDERGVISNLESLGFVRADLHKGIKTLWDENFMDSFRTKFKKPKSTATEAMDEELGIKEHNPTLYEELQTSTLFRTVFQVGTNSECCVEEFQVDPSGGYIAFPRYTEGSGDADHVVHAIVAKNR
jgi:hypothetical protein